MLLLIAVANAHAFLFAARPLGLHGYPVAESTVDKLAILIPLTLVDGRELSLFAFLFGYGLVQLARRLAHEGADENAVLRLLRRRGWCLVLIGFAHALLLFGADIIAAFGLMGVLLAGVAMRASDRKLLTAAGLGLVLIALVSALAEGTRPERANLPLLDSLAVTEPGAAVGARLADWVPMTLGTAFAVVAPPMLLGVWAARRRILEDPERHRALLLRVCVGGLGLAYLGGLPLAVTAAMWQPDWSPSAATAAAGSAHAVTGVAGAMGYAALAGLVAIRLRGRRGPVTTALAACGQRSMTCYLLQSVVFVAVLGSWGGGLGNRMGLLETAVFAATLWALTVVLADGMSRFGYRGPAEVLLRRLTYGRGVT